MALRQSQAGFMLLDALLGAALFAIFIAAVGVTILVGQISFLKSGDTSRASFLSEKGLEVVRSIRDANWDSLVAGGPFGFSVHTSGIWEFSGTGSSTSDGYTTSVTLAEVSDNSFLVTSTTSWNISKDRQGQIELISLVSNWRAEQFIGDWSSISVEGSYTDGGTPLFQKVAVQGDYAFVTSDKTSGGAGLYIFDISDTSNPTRIASSFTLPGNGHDLVLAGSKLFVVSESSNAEVAVYDIENPEIFSAASLLDTANIPGSGRARSVAYYDGYIYVGATEDGSEDELYSYSVAEDGTLTLQDSFNTEGSLSALILKNAYAYMASTENVAELHVVDIFDPTDIQESPGGGYNLTDVYDATTIHSFGTGIILGRMQGGVIEEVILFDIAESPVPSPPPGPYYFEISEDVYDITAEPGGRYAFIASNFEDKELQIIQPNVLVAGGSAEASFYNADEAGRGVWYDLVKDRLFFVTNSSLFIFQPN